MGDGADMAREQEEVARWEHKFKKLQILLYAKDCFDKNIWLTRDGRRIPLQQMSDGHLKLAIQSINNGIDIFMLSEKWLPKLTAEQERRKTQ